MSEQLCGVWLPARLKPWQKDTTSNWVPAVRDSCLGGSWKRIWSNSNCWYSTVGESIFCADSRGHLQSKGNPCPTSGTTNCHVCFPGLVIYNYTKLKPSFIYIQHWWTLITLAAISGSFMGCREDQANNLIHIKDCPCEALLKARLNAAEGSS